MSDEHTEGGQPVGQLSPDGKWRWDGHNWVPVQQQATPPYPQQPGQQPGQQQYGPPQVGASPYAGQQYAGQQYGAPQYGAPQYGGMPPGAVPQKSGMPTWGKVLLILLSLFVGLIVLLTVVGLAAGDSYADWSCQDVADEALTIDGDNSAFVLQDVTDLEIVEDNREDFEAPESGHGVILSCQGTGTFEDVDETAPVLVELSEDSEGDQYIRYQVTTD